MQSHKSNTFLQHFMDFQSSAHYHLFTVTCVTRYEEKGIDHFSDCLDVMCLVLEVIRVVLKMKTFMPVLLLI